MRIKTMDDVRSLGESAKKQIDALLKQQGGFDNTKRASSASALRKSRPKNDVAGDTGYPGLADTPPKRNAPSRVMRTEDGATYCPYPSPDPFVAVIQRLATKYGIFGCGGMLLTELIIDGGSKNWRFDIALISPFELVDIQGKVMYLGYACLVEADGYGFHRSKSSFKNDRAKQTHALKHGFVVKRITNDDARHRLDEVIEDIDRIFSQPRLYPSMYHINAKGNTQCVLSWENPAA